MICYLLILICIVEFSRKRYFNSLMIFFFLLLEGFQLIPMDILTIGFFSGTSIDAALMAFLGLFCIRGQYWLKSLINKASFSKAIWLFIIILVLNMGYGLLNGYAPGDIFKGARLYILLLSFLMLAEVPMEVLLKVIKVLIIITFFQSVLFLLQVITGRTILLQGPKELDMEELNYRRFYNVPKLLDLALASCLFWFPFRLSKKIRIIFIAVFVLTAIAPLHRGYIFSWILTVTLYSLLFNNYAKKALYLSLIAGGIIVILSVEVLRDRFMEAFDQLAVLGDIVSNKLVYDSNTFLYRVNHLTERLSYINKEPIRWLMGIGLIDEKAPQVTSLPLQYGLPDPVTGNPIKVYTPDLVWSMLLLTMGYVGGLFYMNIFVRVLRKYSRHIASKDISKVIFTLILIGIFSSFTSNMLLQPFFFIPILMLILLIEKRAAYERKLQAGSDQVSESISVQNLM